MPLSHVTVYTRELGTVLSVFLFFFGLFVFLRNVNLTIFNVVMSWMSVCTALYGCISLIPIFRRDSPYYTPLTPLERSLVAVIYIVTGVLYFSLFFSLFICTFFCRAMMPFATALDRTVTTVCFYI